MARSFIKLTTDYPPLTIGIMTAITFVMLIGIGKMNINGAMEVYLPKGSVEESYYWRFEKIIPQIYSYLR